MGLNWRKVFWRVVACIRTFLDFMSDVYYNIKYKDKKEPLPPISNPLLLEPVHALAAKIRLRKLKSEDLLNAYIERINEINPIINAVVDTRFEAALAEARAVDKLLESGEIPSEGEKPFLGVPFSIKDSFRVIGLKSTLGLPCRRNCLPSTYDADVVVNLRKAGAIPLCVTNVSELCMWWESSNSVYGRTNNPYDTTRTPGGSSGGEGALQTSAGIAISLGSDIGGSVRIPAFFCGLFGHKPSPGVVSNVGQGPEFTTDLEKMLSVGPICRYATDLLPLLKVMAGPTANLLQLDTQVNIKSLRVFYLYHDGGHTLVSYVHKDIQQAITNSIAHLAKAFGLKPQKADLPRLRYGVPIWISMIMGTEVDSPKMPDLLNDFNEPVNLWKEFGLGIMGRSDHSAPALLLALLELLRPGRGTPEHANFINLGKQLRTDVLTLLGTDGILILPTHPRPAPHHNQPLFMPMNAVYTAVFNSLGFPATNVPMGLNKDGLPVGIQVVAAPYNDHLCLAVARELEKAFGGWVPPSSIL